jgi:hypothetical protein
MVESDVTKLPDFQSLDELVNFFDSHDFGDYLEQLPEADFAVNIQQRVYQIVLDHELADRLAAIARAQHTSSAKLVEYWVREKILEQAA